MQFKRFTFAILSGIMMFICGVAVAQEDATIDPSAIRYWVGEGQNEVVFIVNWNAPDTALAWGYRFSEDYVVVESMMQEIASTDSRFSYDATSGFVSNIYYHDDNLELHLAGSYWLFNVNGVMANDYYNVQTIGNGDYVKWGDESCGTDLGDWNYVWTKEVAAVYPLADDAIIDPSEVLYWIGEGPNEVVFIVNWNEPNTALAWGYRFDGESVVVKDVMDAIAEHDRRFIYEASGTIVGDIKYNDGTLDLSLAGMYWLMAVNGSLAWYGFEEQTVVNGDYVKWGDESCATEIAQWTYVWEQAVMPVSPFVGVNEQGGNTVAMYPNPAVSDAWISVDMEGDATLTISDLTGRVVAAQQVSAGQNDPIHVDTRGLHGGLYVVTVSNAQMVQTGRLIVK